MIDPADCARALIETFDKGALESFRTWLHARPTMTKWMIAGDFVLRDKTRPQDCFAFSIIPYDTDFATFAARVNRELPRDIKNSKTLGAEAAAWLKGSGAFHILVAVNQDRRFYHAPDRSQIEVIRDSLAQSITALQALDRGPETLLRFRNAADKARANNFNVGLFTDLTLLALILPVLTLLLARERRIETIGWFCDRDSMTNWLDGIVWNMALENLHGLAERVGIDIGSLNPVIGAPDLSSGREEMWFDHLIRPADWMAGTIAAWDWEGNMLPNKHDKYVRMAEDVLADSENIVVLRLRVEREGMKASQVLLRRSPAVDTL